MASKNLVCITTKFLNYSLYLVLHTNRTLLYLFRENSCKVNQIVSVLLIFAINYLHCSGLLYLYVCAD